MHTTQKLEADSFQVLGDLIWHEGPFLCHLVDGGGRDYFISWVRVNGQFNRWHLFEVSKKGLQAFFFKKKSVRQLLLENPAHSVWLVDVDNDANWAHSQLMGVENLTSDLLPGEKSFFDEKHCEPYALQLREELRSKQRFEAPEFVDAAAAFQPSLQI